MCCCWERLSFRTKSDMCYPDSADIAASSAMALYRRGASKLQFCFYIPKNGSEGSPRPSHTHIGDGTRKSIFLKICCCCLLSPYMGCFIEALGSHWIAQLSASRDLAAVIQVCSQAAYPRMLLFLVIRIRIRIPQGHPGITLLPYVLDNVWSGLQ